MFNKTPTLPPKQQPALVLSNRPKPPRNIEEWLKTQKGLTREERAQWPLECSDSVTQLDKPLHDECPTMYKVDGDVFLSLKAIKNDLEKHSPWDSSCLDVVAQRLQEVDKKIGWYADRFISDGHPLATDRDNFRSVAGGLTNITNIAFLTELCDMDLINSRQLAVGFKKNKTPSIKNSTGKDERTVEAIYFPGIGSSDGLSLPSKLEPLPILDLVTKAHIPSHLSKSWKKVFFTDASTSLLISSFWWTWMDYFKPDKSLQAALFETVCENFVVLLNGIDDAEQKDSIFMNYPDCLSQALYSVFCQACPGSNKIVNSERFLNYLTNLISEWIKGIKVGPGTWRRWPRYLLDPYHTTGHNRDRPPSSARAASRALTDSDIMALSMSTNANPLAWQQSQNSRVQFRRSRSGRNSCATGYRRLLSGSIAQSSPQGSPYRSTRAMSSSMPQGRGSLPQENESSSAHVGPGPIFECVRFGILGRSPLLHHFMIRHGLVDLDAPPGPTISRRQVKEGPHPSIGYRDLLRQSEETSERKYDQYQREIAKSVQESVTFQKHHNTEMRKLDKHNRRILSHRHEVSILAEKLLSRKKKQRSKAGTPLQDDH